MSVSWAEYQAAISDAKITIYQSDNIVRTIGGLMVTRLRSMKGSDLADMKRKLRKYNTHTRKWSD